MQEMSIHERIDALHKEVDSKYPPSEMISVIAQIAENLHGIRDKYTTLDEKANYVTAGLAQFGLLLSVTEQFRGAEVETLWQCAPMSRYQQVTCYKLKDGSHLSLDASMKIELETGDSQIPAVWVDQGKYFSEKKDALAWKIKVLRTWAKLPSVSETDLTQISGWLATAEKEAQEIDNPPKKGARRKSNYVKANSPSFIGGSNSTSRPVGLGSVEGFSYDYAGQPTRTYIPGHAPSWRTDNSGLGLYDGSVDSMNLNTPELTVTHSDPAPIYVVDGKYYSLQEYNALISGGYIEPNANE